MLLAVGDAGLVDAGDEAAVGADRREVSEPVRVTEAAEDHRGRAVRFP